MVLVNYYCWVDSILGGVKVYVGVFFEFIFNYILNRFDGKGESVINFIIFGNNKLEKYKWRWIYSWRYIKGGIIIVYVIRVGFLYWDVLMLWIRIVILRC